MPDDVLTAQLRRRSGATSTSATSPTASDRSRRLSAAIAARLPETSQVRSRPWSRLQTSPVLRGGSSPLPALASVAAAVVVVVLAASTLPGYVAGPAPSPSAQAPSWYLTTDELARVVAGTDTSSESVGKTVVANVQFVDLSAACPQPTGDCPTALVIAGPSGNIPVDGGFLPISCPAGVGPSIAPDCARPPTPGPTALTIERGFVKFVGSLDAASVDPPWTVDGYLGNSTSGRLALVQGWISAMRPPPCPMPPDGVDPNEPFGCGAASWLTDDAFQPTTGGPDDSTVSVQPGVGIRVENNGYDTFAPSSNLIDAQGFATPQRGLFVLEPADSPAQCFLCASGLAIILARVDPVEVPPPSPSAPPVSTVNPPPTPTPSWLVDGGGLAGLVVGAESGVGIGRTVVATVSLDAAAGCTPTPSDRCDVVVAGSDPPIHVRNVPVAQPCPSDATCILPIFPWSIPSGHTFAFRLNRDGSVDWLGAVAAGGTPWTFDDFHQLLTGLHAGASEADELYPVDGWVLGASMESSCAVAPADPRFACGGEPYWLIADFVPDGVQSAAPPRSIRLTNDLPIAPDHATRAVVLLRPVLAPSPCEFCAFPALASDVIAILDPSIEIPQPTEPTPAPTPSPTIDPLGTKAFKTSSP